MTPEQLAKLQKSSAAARAKFQATYAAAQKPATSGMSASSTSTGSTGSIPNLPAYGANVANFDAKNPTHIALADAGQEWAKANAAGDKAGMSAAAAKGNQIRATGGIPASFDAKKGITTFNTPQPPANVTPSGGYIPAGDAVTNVRSSSDLQQLAQDDTAQERAALLRSINDQVANVKNSAQYANQLIQDNRTLEDQSLLRNLNPFNGRTGYQLSQVQRGRSIDDTSRAATLENQLNTINKELADFDKLTPERQREIYNELLTMERDFGLNAGQLTGQYGGQQTLAARTADQNYGLNYAGVFGTLPGNSQGASVFRNGTGAPISLAAQNQQFNQNVAGTELTATLTGRMPDGTPTTAEQQRQLTNLWQVADATGRIPDALADLYGIQRGTQTQAAKQFAQQLAVSQKNANTSAANQSTSSKNAEFNRLVDIWSAIGKAPDGLQAWGIQPGDPYKPDATKDKTTTVVTSKESADNFNLIFDDLQSEGVTKDTARQLLQANKDYLNDSDYSKLNNWINDNM